jgi:hypothetical protein
LIILFIPKIKINYLQNESTSSFWEDTSTLNDFDWKGTLCLVSPGEFEHKESMLLTWITKMVALLSLFVLFGSGGNILPWAHPLILSSALCFVLFSIVFVRTERNANKPILPLEIFLFPIVNLVLTGFFFSMINHMVSIISPPTLETTLNHRYKVLYNISLFFQAVRLDTIEQAGARLVIPSVSFTVVSALSASFIAWASSPRPTLIAGQLLLCAGTAALLTMAAIFPDHDVPDAVYNLVLVPVSLGVGMIAPSTLLALLSLTNSENHAVMNGGLVMARSLGVFMATAISTTTIQNAFWSALGPVTDRKDVSDVRSLHMWCC